MRKAAPPSRLRHWRRFPSARPRGKARIALRDVAVDDSGMDKVTIVEAINDNMPFLLDSTLAEIAEHGLACGLSPIRFSASTATPPGPSWS